MGQAKNRKSYKNAMSFMEHAQSDASDIVKDAEFLVANKFASWQNIQMPDGKIHIALVFSPTAWWIDEGKLKLKVG